MISHITIAIAGMLLCIPTDLKILQPIGTFIKICRPIKMKGILAEYNWTTFTDKKLGEIFPSCGERIGCKAI